VREIAWLFGFRDARVVLMEFISDGVDRFVGSEVQHQVFVFGPMWLARGLGLYSRESNLEGMKLQF
jgi:hypothetical protein